MSLSSEPTHSIKSWAEDDRPREKLALKGKHALSDAELLAIIMGSGNKEESAVALAKRILHHFHNNWNELAKSTINDLCQFRGVGEAKAISILTAIEIGHRKAQHSALERPTIKSSKKADALFRPYLSDLTTEEVWAAYLNQANKLIVLKKISSGGRSQSNLDPRVIFQHALSLSASGLILAHNHPSGDLSPSKADKEITQKLKQGGLLLDIFLLDHLILSQTSYFSFADHNML